MVVSQALGLVAALGLVVLVQAVPRHEGIIRQSGGEREVVGHRVVEMSAKGKHPAIMSQLFDEPYRPQDSRHFSVSGTSTFSADTAKKFDLSYADGTELQGFQGYDEVYMGDFHAHAPFGVITDCNSPDFNGVDGILGFGLPKPQYYGNALPRPILFALTDQGASGSNTANLPRKFSFFSTDTEAEVQLGGYDPQSASGPMSFVPSLTKTDFSVPVTSLTYGHPGGVTKELLKFKNSGDSLPAIMDSGTSCLVIPADNVYGKLENKPWDDFVDQWQENTSFWLHIGGKEYEIPYSSWYLADSEQTCVQPTPDGMDGLLVGDVFFRQYIVEFNMMDQNRPIIGIAPLNRHYAPIRTKTFKSDALKSDALKSDALKTPQDPHSTKLVLTKGAAKMYPAQHTSMLAEVDRIPIVNKQGTQYFMDVGIGTPKQTFTVIFDTGSNVFGVFTYKNQLPASIKSKLLLTKSVSVRADPENILMLTGKPKRHPPAHAVEQEGVAVSLAMASADLSGKGGAQINEQSSVMSFGVGVLLMAIVANVIAGLHLVSRRTRAQGAAMSAPATLYTLPNAQYAAVSSVPLV